MADNILLASGFNVATDDIGGVHFQRMKLIVGADGTNDGDVAKGNPLPVGAQYNATQVTKTDGSIVVLQSDIYGNLRNFMMNLISGEDEINNIMKTELRLSKKNMTASGQVKASPGRIAGIFVASASATPKLKLWDNTSAAVPVAIDEWVPAGATFYHFGGLVEFDTAIYLTISGTINCTVFYK